MPDTEFVDAVLKIARKTRRIHSEPGEPGPSVVSKIGGAPWWPRGMDRPRCPKYGHEMAFIAQILLADVPCVEVEEDALLSFHYCEECTLAGEMSIGWQMEEEWMPHVDRKKGLCSFFRKVLGGAPPQPPMLCEDSGGYEVRVFPSLQNLEGDGKGVIAEAPIASLQLQLSTTNEIPGPGDIPETIQTPDDFPAGMDDFDENVYPGLVHVMRSKLGGWPSWVQNPCWPMDRVGRPMVFIGQLDWELGERASWANGGYAYLFSEPLELPDPKGELVIQTT